MIPVLRMGLSYVTEQRLDFGAYPGAFWRGQIGAALRQGSCTTGAPNCEGCPVQAGCLYGSSYETPGAMVASGPLASYPDVPHPYVISPRHRGGVVEPGAALGIEVFLFGQTADRWPEWRACIQSLRTDRAALRLIDTAALDQDSTTVEDATVALRATVPRPPAFPERMSLELEHPLRLRRRGRYLGPEALDFAAFYGALSRRVSMLHQVVCGQPLNADFGGLRRLAESVDWLPQNLAWQDWSRISGRQRRRIPMGGVVGRVDLAGVDAALWPWLWLGQWLHVGKGAVMGLGRYRVITS